MIRFEEVNRKNKYYNDVKILYRNAFPKNEQIPLWFLMWRSKRKCVDFFNIYNDNNWIGFIYLITEENLTFIMYFAIDAKTRSKGYGSKVMEAIKQKYLSNRIILNIEEPSTKSFNNKQRIQRKQFYKNNGYTETGFCINENCVNYEMLITGENTVIQSEYLNLLKKFVGPAFGLFKLLKIVKINSAY